jgi:hypothetical protein
VATRLVSTLESRKTGEGNSLDDALATSALVDLGQADSVRDALRDTVRRNELTAAAHWDVPLSVLGINSHAVSTAITMSNVVRTMVQTDWR